MGVSGALRDLSRERHHAIIRRPCSDGYAVTNRKIAAFERKKIRQQAAMPLFAEEIARSQFSAGQEMARRAALAHATEREQRDFEARQWRQVRKRYFALPAHVRAAVRAAWACWKGPPKSSHLAYVSR